MSLLKNRIKATEKKYQRRKSRVNTKIKATQPEYRLVLQKSLLYVSAQLLDRDAKVVASISDKGMKGKTKTERAKLAGEELAKNIKKFIPSLCLPSFLFCSKCFAPLTARCVHGGNAIIMSYSL